MSNTFKPFGYPENVQYANPVKLPNFKKNDPSIDQGWVMVWYVGGKYVGWTTISTGQSFARKNGGGSTRASGGAWVPKIGAGNEITNANIGAIGRAHRVTAADFTDDYFAAFKADIAKGDEFDHAVCVNDPLDKMRKLCDQYVAELKTFEKQLTAKYVQLAQSVMQA